MSINEYNIKREEQPGSNFELARCKCGSTKIDMEVLPKWTDSEGTINMNEHIVLITCRKCNATLFYNGA